MNTFSVDREATYQERSTWGECLVCHVQHGQHCRPEVGLHLGIKPDGCALALGEGTHLGRLMKAPVTIRVTVEGLQ